MDGLIRNSLICRHFQLPMTVPQSGMILAKHMGGINQSEKGRGEQ